MIQFFSFPFSSAHFYHQAAWSEGKNREIFGACFDPYGHGHNYLLQVGIQTYGQTPVHALTISEALAPILKILDHHHLNHQIPFFTDHVPTTENIVLFIAEKIKTSIQGLKVIRLYESDHLWSELQF